MWCVVHNMLTPKPLTLQGTRYPNRNASGDPAVEALCQSLRAASGDTAHGVALSSAPRAPMAAKPTAAEVVPARRPAHPVFTLVLGLTQFLQELFFDLPKLDAHGHLSDELFTALLGDLLAVPQVNVTDVPTALEEGQALVSDFIAV